MLQFLNSLVNINVFDELTEVKGETLLIHHTGAREILTFNNLTTAPGMQISSNEFLFGIKGFQQIEELKHLFLMGSGRLRDLTGFANLRRIENELNISNTDMLTSLDDFSSLTSIGELDLWYNTALTDMCALSTALSSTGGDFDASIQFNAFNPTLEELKAGNCRN